MATIFSQIGDMIGSEIKTLKTSLNGMFSKNDTTGDITFTGNLIPSENEVFSLGSETQRLKDVFISANTIHLGTSTFHGTSIAVDAGDNPTSLADIPTVIASKMVAKPFSYVSGGSTISVRPTIEFQDASGISYPISFDTANNKFSFDAAGNYGQGTVVAKDYEFTGEIRSSAVSITDTLAHIENGLRVDGNIDLGYDEDTLIKMKGTTEFRAPVLFKEGATVGDGNDTIIINAGYMNNLDIYAKDITINGTASLLDKYTKTEVDTKIAAATPDFSSLQGKPTTISGYGITDAITEANTVTLTGDISGSASYNTSGNLTITTTIADDSHNHTIANVDGLQTALDGKLSVTGKAADSELIDGYDSSRLYRRTGSSSATVGAGWITVAQTGSGRFHGEVIVTDADSDDHSFIRIDWMRSYADSNFTVINCGGHANRITGARVLYETADNTYGVKKLQVYVTVSSNYYVTVNKLGDIGGYADLSVVTPVVQNSISGYALDGNELTGLDAYGFATEEGIRVGGSVAINGDLTVGGQNIVKYYEQSAAPASATSGSLWKDTDNGTVYMASNESGVTSWFAV